MPDWLVVVLAALGAGLAGLLAATFGGIRLLVDAWFAERRRRLVRHTYTMGLQRVANFAVILDQLKRVEAVDRVLVFVGQDSGGLPTPGKPYTVKAYIGWSNKRGEDVLKRYDFDIQVDHAYAVMLAKMVSDGTITNTVADMPDTALLKRMYKDEGVVQSLLYFLHCDGSQLTYLSVASYRDKFTEDQKTKIEMMVARMRALMATGE